MTREQLIAFVAEQVPEMKPGTNKQFPEFILSSDALHALAWKLRNNPELRMDYLFCLTAADRKDGLHVFYHLTSSDQDLPLMLRVVLTDKVNPVIPTVSDIWKAAEFYEREVFDLFGIRFENHPDLRRIFLDEDWAGFPLRKDYKDAFTLEH
jgi:NADH:ubiquinone oxidoreductase subunit C